MLRLRTIINHRILEGQGQNASPVGKAFTLHESNLNQITGSIYGSPLTLLGVMSSEPGESPEYEELQHQNKKTMKKKGRS